jgi:hypothetical protein
MGGLTMVNVDNCHQSFSVALSRLFIRCEQPENVFYVADCQAQNEIPPRAALNQ